MKCGGRETRTLESGWGVQLRAAAKSASACWNQPPSAGRGRVTGWTEFTWRQTAFSYFAQESLWGCPVPQGSTVLWDYWSACTGGQTHQNVPCRLMPPSRMCLRAKPFWPGQTWDGAGSGASSSASRFVSALSGTLKRPVLIFLASTSSSRTWLGLNEVILVK